MDVTDYQELGARGLAAAFASGAVAAVEITEAALTLAEQRGPAVGAFVRLAPELALSQAAALDRRRAAGEPLPPLAAVPCPIKDLTPVAGLGWEGGSAALAGNVAEADDGIVGWLREAGTTMIGKTNTPEFGFPCYTEPDNCAPARTPWDLTRSAGGSSGGAAAAVAAGIVPIAHASDGGGSIRIPASACGLVGLKPSRGRISAGPLRDPGIGLGTDGVITRDVRDTALALDLLAGARAGDPFFAPSPATSFLGACDRDPGRLRVGVLMEPVIVEDSVVHPACLAAVEVVAALLVSLGHRVDLAPVPFPAKRWAAFESVWTVGALSIPLPEEAEPLLRPLTRWLRDRGRAVSGLDYAQAVTSVQQLTRETATAWADFDAVLTPTLASPPAFVGELRNDADPASDFQAQMEFTPWTSVANLTGRPAISLPLGQAMVDGVTLPIGVMLTGRPFGEDTLLGLAAQLEEAAPWARLRPGRILGA